MAQMNETPGVGSPISDDAFNAVAALHEKLGGLEAYRKYAQSGRSDVWKRLTDADLASVDLLCDEIERLVSEGKFRLREPGRARG